MGRKRVGILLSGCGVKDGSEIHEAVLTMLALDRADVEVVCLAPDIEQVRVVNHVTGEATAEKRGVLAESARIARGKIKDLANVTAADLDGIALPGGFGAVTNLSSFSDEGAQCRVNREVERLLRELHAAGKPILALCIAPATVARVLGGSHVRVTIGTDEKTAARVEATGAVHTPCAVADCVVDRGNKVVTTPAYMLASRIAEVATGVDNAVAAFVPLLG